MHGFYNQQIQKAIEELYNHPHLSLALNEQQLWAGVLRYRDWTQLKQLWLKGCSINDNNIIVLAQLKWPHLLHLSLNQNEFTCIGVKNLLQNQYPQLQGLYLTCNKIGSQGINLLLSTEKLPKIKNIVLARNGITATGLIKTPDSSVLKNIESFGFVEDNIGAIGIKLIIKASMRMVKRIVFRKCQTGREGVKHLSKAQWPNLQRLQISQNGFFPIQDYEFPSTQQVFFGQMKTIQVYNIFVSNLGKNSSIVFFTDINDLCTDLKTIIAQKFEKTFV